MQFHTNLAGTRKVLKHTHVHISKDTHFPKHKHKYSYLLLRELTASVSKLTGWRIYLLPGNLHIPSSCVGHSLPQFNDTFELTRWWCSHSMGLIRPSKMLQWPKLEGNLHKRLSCLKDKWDRRGSFSFLQLQSKCGREVQFKCNWRKRN